MSKVIERGHHAERLLQDPLIVEALESIEHALREAWDGANTTEFREEVWYTLKGMQRFTQYLRLAVEQGDFEVALKEKQNG